MSLKIMPIPPIPEETARVVHAAFPNGTLLIQIRDALGTLYTDDFADLFPAHGQPAEVPWRLAPGAGECFAVCRRPDRSTGARAVLPDYLERVRGRHSCG